MAARIALDYSPPRSPRVLSDSKNNESDSKTNAVFKRKLPIPSTPMGTRKIQNVIRQPFSRKLTSKATQIYSGISNFAYQTPSGREHCLIKQRGSKNCGGAASLMFTLSFLGQDILTEAYLNHCDNLCLASSRQIVSGIHKYVKSDVARFEIYDDRSSPQALIDLDIFLQFLKDKLTSSDASIIVGIQHEQLEGHYIVLDEYSEEFFYIRDPFSGSAFRLTAEEFKENIDPECGISIVFKE